MTNAQIDPEPLLTEERHDGYGTYTQEWYCQPPAPGAVYMVTHCTWTPDHKTRRIYAIELGRGQDRRAPH